MAKKSSLFDDLFFIASKLPWWLSLAIALVSGFALHSLANQPATFSGDPHRFQSAVLASMARTAAGFGQYLLPFIFGCGTIAALFRRFRSRSLLTSAATSGGNTLLSISWHEFELLVGEALRRRGYKVQDTGSNGPDGGIDLVARKDGETYLVQCKQWRSVQVGVPVVRELYGAMAAEGAVGGFVVTSGTFTKQARDFASGRNLQLVDGNVLKQWIAETKKPGPRPTVEVVAERVEPMVIEPEFAVPVVSESVAKPETPEVPIAPKPPACPHCRKTMVMRVARTGANAGGNFWGCADYPKCRGIRAIFAPMRVK
ncbi:restriction endonuclease [Pseudomonas bohemica]|uniref:restriction endonuclease n=1 Tax=Pseudomonas bohemica TaxID=2044872 RepID=UPI000DA608E3|nr:restriction endonuclease [Pseudomonas bohemica]